jgi:hypothetical protein
MYPVPNGLKMTLVYTVGPDINAQNILHFSWTGQPPNAADCNAIASHAQLEHTSLLNSYFHSAVVSTAINVLDLSSQNGAAGSSGGGGAGSRAGTPLDASTCALISWPISQRYRGGHPRTYVPAGVAADLASASSWTTAFVSGLGSAYNNFIGQIVGYAYSVGSISAHTYVNYYSGHNWTTAPPYKKIPIRVNPPVAHAVGTGFVRTTPANQRKRLRPG